MKEPTWNTLVVRPAPRLEGEVDVPGDKSISHRAVLLAALGRGTSRIRAFLYGGDCEATLRAVAALGVQVERPAPDTVILHSTGPEGWREPPDVIDCVNSGTTMRLLAGLLAAQPFTSILTGSAQLRRRPMGRVTRPLRQMGATILGREDGRYAPLAVRGGHLQGIVYDLPIASAQVKSALILAGLFAEGRTVVREPGPARDHTERMLAALGAAIEVVGREIRVTPLDHPLPPLDLTVPGDISSAAFPIVAALLVPAGEVRVRGVGVNPTRTGLLDVLQSMGAAIALENPRTVGGEPVADIVVRPSRLQGTTVAGETVVRMIDEFPIFAVAATQAEGTTIVRDAAELRVKETDRIATVVGELRRLGAAIEERPDGFVVEGPTRLQGAVVSSHGDHRLAMALAVAGLLATGETVVRDAACLADSFPTFVDVFRRLGAAMELTAA